MIEVAEADWRLSVQHANSRPYFFDKGITSANACPTARPAQKNLPAPTLGK